MANGTQSNTPVGVLSVSVIYWSDEVDRFEDRGSSSDKGSSPLGSLRKVIGTFLTRVVIRLARFVLPIFGSSSGSSLSDPRVSRNTCDIYINCLVSLLVKVVFIAG